MIIAFEKKIYAKIIIGCIASTAAVFFSVAINGFPSIDINGPFKWFDPDKYPITFIIVIGLVVTIITALIQIEIETKLYTISSIINGFSFNETITKFIVKYSGSETSSSHVIAAKNNIHLFTINQNLLTSISKDINPDSFILLANVATFVGTVSILLNIIILIVKEKSNSKRVQIKILSEQKYQRIKSKRKWHSK